jgi:1-aminocyclopropane-1-carboxylate deaminase
MMSLQLQKSRVDTIHFLSNTNIAVDVLRLDLLHPAVSGNKWFKLKEYLKQATEEHKNYILTFGGAYSNHIVATAAAAEATGFKSIGLIRGERLSELSCSLQIAREHGMELYFLSREVYQSKTIPGELYEKYGDDLFVINEGGAGKKGMLGAADILSETDIEKYTHIVAAVGTGTTLAGLIEASAGCQKILGISVLKNNFSLESGIRRWLSLPYEFFLLHDYHFGGYAKYDKTLIAFMNEWYEQTAIPSDFVYTAKLFFAARDLISKNYFPSGSRILIIHSGGLQGNCSLPKGTLIF